MTVFHKKVFLGQNCLYYAAFCVIMSNIEYEPESLILKSAYNSVGAIVD